jgi:formylglycine-generating enzyme required for sulfatase activity
MRMSCTGLLFARIISILLMLPVLMACMCCGPPEDSGPMFIHIDSPNMDDFYCGPFTVEGEAVDEGPGIEELILYVDGVEFDNIELNEAYSYSFEFDVYISSLPIECGVFEIEVVAIDGDRDEESASVDVTICNDDVDPIVVLSTDTEVITSIYQPATITVDITEDNLDTYSYEGPGHVSEVEDGYEISIIGEQLEEGENIISFMAIDKCGNEGSGEITLTFEPELVLVMTSPEEGECLCDFWDYYFEAEIEYRGNRLVQRVCFYFDEADEPVCCDMVPPYTCEFVVSNPEPGGHCTYAVAEMLDGSEVTSTPVCWVHSCPPTADLKIVEIDQMSKSAILDASASYDDNTEPGLTFEFSVSDPCIEITQDSPSDPNVEVMLAECAGGGVTVSVTVRDGWCDGQDTATVYLSEAVFGFVSIQGGAFMMGAADDDTYGDYDELPQHEVTLTNAIDVMATEVTNKQYAGMVQWALENGHVVVIDQSYVLGALDGSNRILLHLGGSLESEISFHNGEFIVDEGRENHPVKAVTWFGSARYCDWLSMQFGLPRAYEHSGDWSCNGGSPYTASGFRLPTEPEWEYACRAGTETRYNTGGCLDSSTEANFYGQYPIPPCPPGSFGDWSVPVASYLANPWSLFDMHGNSWEWGNDWYGDDYYQQSEAINPIGPDSGEFRILRGGGWNSPGDNCRSASRSFYDPVGAGSDIVFRPVRTIH